MGLIFFSWIRHAENVRSIFVSGSTLKIYPHGKLALKANCQTTVGKLAVEGEPEICTANMLDILLQSKHLLDHGSVWYNEQESSFDVFASNIQF